MKHLVVVVVVAVLLLLLLLLQLQLQLQLQLVVVLLLWWWWWFRACRQGVRRPKPLQPEDFGSTVLSLNFRVKGLRFGFRTQGLGLGVFLVV